MTITINDPKIESRLSQDATEAGLTVNDYVHKLLQEVIEHIDPSVANFDTHLARITRPLNIIPGEMQGREQIYED